MDKQNIDLFILGIDISKNKFDVALLKNNKYRHRKFRNNADGHEQLVIWLNKLNSHKKCNSREFKKYFTRSTVI
jgi:translation elongation factor EF-1alpha